MIPKLQSGEFYGLRRKQVKSPAFVFAEVEDYVNCTVPMHTHEDTHFLFVVRGEYQASVRNKERFCNSSAMLYYPAGTTHCDHFHNAGGKFLTISLIPEPNKKLFEEISFFDHSIDFNDPEITWLGKKICRELQSPDSLTSVVLEAMGHELLVFAARMTDKSDKTPGWLKQAYELLNDCCSEEVTIAEIAATVGVHRLHLARTFRKFFNCSPGEYLRQCRINLAGNLLLNSKKTLVEIALTCGYADQSQFTRSFRQATGTTPAKFREIYHS